ncbi:MAG: ACP phosphodiesterase [Ferruginibacter sp.]
MNYLAHAYLSFEQPQILAGNMISDFVKGKLQYEYEKMIQKGIRLHRSIDNFTDSHPIIKEMKKPFREKYGLYSGAFTDIVCDYFLANDRNEFDSSEILSAFSKSTYIKLDDQLSSLPKNFQQTFRYMKEYDWLFNYRFEWVIQKSFASIVKRAKYMDDADTAFKIFIDSKEKMQPYYNDFFPLLKNHAILTLKELLNND